MTLTLRNTVLFGLLLAALVACGASAPSADLTAAREGLPVFPAAESRGTGHPPPGFYQIDYPKDFTADATYFAAGIEAGDAIQEFFKTELPKLGWAVEDPSIPSRDSQLAGFCQTTGFVTCKSYTKDQVRAIVLTLTSFSLSGSGRDGVGYHLHVENK